MEITIDASKIAQLEEFFNELSTLDQRKIFMTAFRRAAKPLVQRAKATAPVGDTGTLRKSIGTIEVPNEIALIVGAKNTGANKGWYGHFLEDGVSQERFRKTKKGKASTGKLVGTHFFENAYEGTEEEVMEAVEGEYYAAIDNAIVKFNKKKNDR